MLENTFSPISSFIRQATSLTIDGALIYAGVGDWSQGFPRIERLTVNYIWRDSDTLEGSLMPLRKFQHSPLSPYLRSSFHIRKSFVSSIPPLLEDLSLIGYDVSAMDELPAIDTSATPPLTGTLKIALLERMTNTARRLLDIPNGLRF